MNTLVRIVTHDGRFHADDVFAIAALQLYFEKQKQPIEIIRSRDETVIKTADIVVDNGRTYDPDKKIFDHHQTGGAGVRSNGVPYAAFGLIWKHYGDFITDSVDVTKVIDEKLVQSIDFVDCDPRYADVQQVAINQYMIDDLVKSFYPTRYEHMSGDEAHIESFLKAVAIARQVLGRELLHAQLVVSDMMQIEKIYQEAEDKRIIVIDAPLSWTRVLCSKREPLFVVHPKYHGEYAVRAVPIAVGSYKNRAYLPKEWGGKSGAELEKISGISGATFCHSGLHLAGAKTKEDAIAMAEKAIAVDSVV